MSAPAVGLRAAAPDAPTTLVWKAVQRYRNGTVVRWTGEPGQEEASRTRVTRAAAATSGTARSLR